VSNAKCPKEFALLPANFLTLTNKATMLHRRLLNEPCIELNAIWYKNNKQ